MTTRIKWISSFLFLVAVASAQNFKGICKIDALLHRIENKDTTYVINFWATWCKPCIQELPAFDSLYASTKKTPVKVILVSLDFKEELEKQVKPFLVRRSIAAECILLDEVNGNEFINKISPDWSGAIPATLFKSGEKKLLIEKKMRLSELREQISLIEKQ